MVTQMKSKYMVVSQLNIRFSMSTYILFILATFITFSPNHAQADAKTLAPNLDISVEKLSENAPGLYGYKLQYIVPVPVTAYWRFKTDFDSNIQTKNSAITEHRFIDSESNYVITENRFAAAPGIRFIWKTTVIADEYKLKFKLLNVEESRHQFHFGSIKISPAGNHTIVTQRAFFNFDGASFWVNYPWYGGMKSTLTTVAKWEQDAAKLYMPGSKKSTFR